MTPPYSPTLALLILAASVPPLAALPFQEATLIDAVSSPREWLTVADLNGDAHPDILCTAPDQNLRWWKNNGAGVFAQQPDIPISGGVPVTAVARPIDRDDDIDLIVLIDPGNANGRIHLLKNDGEGVFTKSGEILLSGKLIPGSLPLAEDFDSDGDIDVMQAHQDAAQAAGADPLSLALNDGIGGFAAPVEVTSSLNWPTALAWHDCDKNGRPDLLVATTGVSQLRLYRNYKPGGGLLLADLISLPPAGIQEIVGLGPGQVALRYDGPGSGSDAGLQYRLSVDGYLDWIGDIVSVGTKPVVSLDKAVLSESGDGGLIYVRRDPLIGERTLAFARMDRNLSSLSLGPTDARTVRAADIDHDGDTDLVLLRGADLALHRNDSIRPTTTLTETGVKLTLAHPPVDVLAIADVLPDPGPEIVGALTAEGSLRVFAIDGIQPQPGSLITTAAPGVTALKAADLDRDGDTDLVFNAPGDDRIKWLRNNGGGTFAAPATILAKADPGPLDIGDVDRDGDLDVAMTFADGSVVVAISDGGNPPTWTMENGGTTGHVPLDIKIADVLGGQRQELLLKTFAFGAPANASTLRRYSYIPFPSPGWYSITVATGPAGVGGIAVADVEPDGDLDVIAGPGSTPSVYTNDGMGNLSPVQPAAPAEFTALRRLFALDLDRNGSAEAVALNAGGLLAASVAETGFGSRLQVQGPAGGVQLRDVAPVSLYGENDFLVVSESTTPALHVIRNNIQTISHSVAPAGAAPDPRGGSSLIFSLSLTSQAPPGGPTVDLYSLYFSVRLGDAAMPMEIFEKLVTGVDVWRDAGTPGVLDPADSLLGTTSGSLAGDGNLPVSLFHELLAPLQTKRWLVSLRLAPDELPGVDQFAVIWGGDSLRLTAFATGDLGASGVIAAVTPPVIRNVHLANLSPLQQWRLTWWGTPDNTGNGNDLADPEKDGVPNLVEYALGTNPLAADASPLSPFLDAANRQAVATSLADPPRPDITVTLEASPSLQGNSWSVFAVRSGNGGWTGPAMVTPGPSSGGRQSFTFADPPPSAAPSRFVRLRVSY